MTYYPPPNGQPITLDTAKWAFLARNIEPRHEHDLSSDNSSDNQANTNISGSSSNFAPGHSISPDQPREVNRISSEFSREINSAPVIEHELSKPRTRRPPYLPIPPPANRIKIKRFTVEFGSKHDHPNEPDIPGDIGIIINQVTGPVLKLRRGLTYQFDVKPTCQARGDPPHQLMFTYSVLGGPGGYHRQVFSNIRPFDHGRITLHIGSEVPDYFYYQCTAHPLEGGPVIVVD